MKNRTSFFVSVVLLILYGTVTMVTVPLHFHEDSFFYGGNGQQTIAEHDDAAHCHHRSVDVHFDCTICSFISHTSFSSIVSFIPQFNPKSIEYISAIFVTDIYHSCSSHPHRGPPVTLA